jgi:Ca-activated chloride channel family protein
MPNFDDLPVEEIPKSEIIFVLDCSGSMQGTSITEAKEALELSLRALSEKERFNIFRFGSVYKSFSQQSMEYSSKTLDKALYYLQRIDADMGGTEIYRPLEHICSLPVMEGYRRDVLLLTDGEVANPDEVIQMVSSSVEKNPSLRFFTFGIGYGASHHLVKGIARAGQGKCEMVMPGEKIQPKVLRQFSRMSQPSMTEASLSFESAEAGNLKILPPLFEGDSYCQLRKLNRVKEAAKVTFNGSYMGKHHSWVAELVDAGRDNTMLILWAMSRIEHLKTHGIGGSNQKGRQQQRIKNEVTRLGLRYNLLSDYTSFVCVEKRADGQKEPGQPEYRRIPVMMTRDWHGIDSFTPTIHLSRIRGNLICTPQKMGLKKLGYSGISKEVTYSMPPTFESKRLYKKRKPDFKKKSLLEDSKEADALWYLELLKTQQADGSFVGLKILSRHLGITYNKLKIFSTGMDGISSKLKEKVLVTWLAVCVLSTDPEASAITERSIQKAKVWLSQNKAERPTVNGVQLEDAFKKSFGIALLPSF